MSAPQAVAIIGRAIDPIGDDVKLDENIMECRSSPSIKGLLAKCRAFGKMCNQILTCF
jgi:hypothetical protein